MTRYLLDTNACIHILNGSSTAIVERLKQAPGDAILLCSVVKAELLYGAWRSGKPAENLRGLRKLFGTFDSLPFDDGCAERAGFIRNELARLGQPIGSNDLYIAAIALANDLTLVTHNTREFSRVVGLSLEDWVI